MKNLFKRELGILLTAAILFALTLLVHKTKAQTPGTAPACGTTGQHLSFLRDPKLKKSYADAQKRLGRFAAEKSARTNGTDDVVYTIPLVIHVFENSATTQFITDSEIFEAVANLNKAFRRQFSNSDGVDTEIQFQLAARTPANEVTNGIVRVDASGLPRYVQYGASGPDGEPVDVLYNMSSWPNLKYYNVWVVHQLNGAVAFAVYPTGAEAIYDGTTISTYFLNTKTFAHELGHGLDLRHTFAYTLNGPDSDFTSCPPNADCTTDGDGICDTDPINQSANTNPDCNQNENKQNPCTGIGYGQVLRNYMGYQFDHCITQFTNDQRTRMRNVLLTLRSDLHDNESLLPPGTLPVRLVDFYGQASENSVSLSWSTSMEKGNDYFDVENSLNAKDFKAVGRVNGIGEVASALSKYEFTHIPDNRSEVQYYRLKQVDTDGTYAYSKIVHVPFSPKSDITISPNPIIDQITLAGLSGKWKTEIFSASGQYLFQVRDQKYIDVKSLVPGLYVIRIIPENGRLLTKKLVKMN